MSTHNHLPMLREDGLQDDCPRCAELAQDPVAGFDEENLRALITRTLAWMRDEAFPRSETENVAMRKIEDHIRFARAMKRLLPEVPA